MRLPCCSRWPCAGGEQDPGTEMLGAKFRHRTDGRLGAAPRVARLGVSAHGSWGVQEFG